MSQISFRTSNFLNEVVYGIAHSLGIDPQHDILKDHARAWASAISTRLRWAWEFYDWPELRITEERAFRQVFYSDVTYASAQGDNSQVYYPLTDVYYSAFSSPPAGTLPTDATYWAEMSTEDVAATGTLTCDGTNPTSLQTVTIGSKTYTFRSALTPLEGEVLLGVGTTGFTTTLQNLVDAINHTGTPGTQYSCAAAHPTVSAARTSTTVVEVTARVSGTTGNLIATTEASSRLSWAAAKLTGGQDALDRHIAYRQYGKQDMGQVYGIYDQNPRMGTTLQWAQAPGDLGIDVSLYAGNTVWVNYKPRQPQFTSNTYSDSYSYTVGDTVLDLTSGDCYVAIANGSNNALTETAYWLVQEFPYAFTEYVVAAVASDMADDEMASRRFLQQADDFLYREVDKQIEQGQIHRYGPRQPYRLPLGTSTFAWSAYRQTA